MFYHAEFANSDNPTEDKLWTSRFTIAAANGSSVRLFLPCWTSNVELRALTLFSVGSAVHVRPAWRGANTLGCRHCNQWGNGRNPNLQYFWGLWERELHYHLGPNFDSDFGARRVQWYLWGYQCLPGERSVLFRVGELWDGKELPRGLQPSGVVWAGSVCADRGLPGHERERLFLPCGLGYMTDWVWLGHFP